MPSLKKLRRRLRTVESTKTITRAMRSVAASKMRKTQDQRTKTKPYVDHLQKLVANVLQNTSLEGQPLLEEREGKKKLFLVIASDRGLCGAFNATINDFAEEEYLQYKDQGAAVFTVGKRAHSHFTKLGAKVVGTENELRGNVVIPKIIDVNRQLQQLFLSGEFDRVELLYNHAITAMTYRPKHEILLPLQPDELLKEVGEEEEKPLWEKEYIFEPEPKALLGQLLPKFVETKILFTIIDALTAEHQARQMAMSTANENCMELMDSLTLELNKARQTMITKELLEIVGGAEALKG
ncbi:ATP synthase F1 subunit gamma [bacterium]|nr:ATP synthase F1 subunit gamma [bacterium]